MSFRTRWFSRLSQSALLVLLGMTLLSDSAGASSQICVPLLDSGMALGQTDCSLSADSAHQVSGDGYNAYVGPSNITVAGTSLSVGSSTCDVTLNGINFEAAKAQPGDLLVFTSPSGKVKVLPLTAVSGFTLTYSTFSTNFCSPTPETTSHYNAAIQSQFAPYFGGASGVPGTFHLARPKPTEVVVNGNTNGQYCTGGPDFGLPCVSACLGGYACQTPDYQILWHEIEHDRSGQYNLIQSEILSESPGTDFSRTVTLKPGINRFTRLQYMRNQEFGGRIERVGDTFQQAEETVEIDVESVWEYSPGAVLNGHFIKSAYSGGFNQPYMDEGDLDGDGRLDLIVLDKINGLLWYRNDGWGPEGVAQFSRNSENLALSATPNFTPYFSSPGIGDVTGDSHPDLVVGQIDGSLRVFENVSHYDPIDGRLRGPILFEEMSAHSLLSISTSGYAAPEFGDWDNDGDDDLFICSGSNNVKMHKNLGGGIFASSALSYNFGPDVITGAGATLKRFCRVRTGDLNADGLLDFLISNSESYSPSLFINAGSSASPLWIPQGEINIPTGEVKPSASMAVLPLRKNGPALCLGGTLDGSSCGDDPAACETAGGECRFFPDVVYLMTDGANLAVFRGMAGGAWPQTQTVCSGGANVGTPCSSAAECGAGSVDCLLDMANTYQGASWNPFIAFDLGSRSTMTTGNYQLSNPRRTCIGGVYNGTDCTYDDTVCGTGTCLALAGGLKFCEGGALDGTDCTDDAATCQSFGGKCKPRRNDALVRASNSTGIENYLFRGEQRRCEGGVDHGAICWIDSDCDSAQCVDDGIRCSGGPNAGMRCDPALAGADCPGRFCKGGDLRGEICAIDSDCPGSVCRDASCMKNGVPAFDSRPYCMGGSQSMSDCESAAECSGAVCASDSIDCNCPEDEVYQIVDWENDGDMDILTPLSGDSIKIYWNCDVLLAGDIGCGGTSQDPWLDGSFNYQFDASMGPAGSPGGSSGIYSFDAMDFDNNQMQDLIIVHDQNYTLYPNTGDPTRPYCFSNPLDAYSCNSTPRGSMTKPNSVLTYPHTESAILLDVDKDGLLDLVFSEGITSEFWIYKNTGNSTLPEYKDALLAKDFLGLRWSPNSLVTATVRAGDLNGDGDRDVWLSDLYGGLHVYLKNDGAPTVAFNALPFLADQQTGEVEIDLSVSEGDLSPVDLFVEFTDLSNGLYYTSYIGSIVENPGGAFIDNLSPDFRVFNASTVADPSRIRLYWSAGLDLGFNFNGSLRVRVTARDADGETATALSDPFFLDMSVPYSNLECLGAVYANASPVPLNYQSKFTVDGIDAIDVNFYVRTVPGSYALDASLSQQTSYATNVYCNPAIPLANCSLYQGSVAFTPSFGEGTYELYSVASDPVTSANEPAPMDLNLDGAPDADCAIIYDLTPPVVTIASPVDGAVVSSAGDVTVTGSITDLNFFGLGPECLSVLGDANLTFCEGDLTAGGQSKIVFSGSGSSATYALTLEPADLTALLTFGADSFQVQVVDLAGNVSSSAPGGNPTANVTFNNTSDNLRMTFPQQGQMITSGQTSQPAVGETSGVSPVTLTINGVSAPATLNIATGVFTWSVPLANAPLVDGCVGNTARAVSVNGGDTGPVDFCYSLAGALANIRVRVIEVGGASVPGGTFQDRASAMAGQVVRLQVEGLDNFGNAGAPIAGSITWSKIGDVFTPAGTVTTTAYPNDTFSVVLQTVPANFDLGATQLESVGLVRAQTTDLDPITGAPLADYSGVIESLSSFGVTPASTPIVGIARNADLSFPSRYQFQMAGFKVPSGETLDPFNMDPTLRIRSDLSLGNGYDETTGQFVFDLASFRENWAAGDTLYLRFNNAESGHQAWYECPLASVSVGSSTNFSAICCPMRWAIFSGQLAHISSCATDVMGDVVLQPRSQELVTQAFQNLNKMVVPTNFGAVLRAFDLLKTVPVSSQISVFDNITKQPYSMSIFSDENVWNSLVTPGRNVESRVSGNSVWP